eukprot:351140-Chlamydomonas_euryale.AAC.42
MSRRSRAAPGQPCSVPRRAAKQMLDSDDGHRRRFVPCMEFEDAVSRWAAPTAFDEEGSAFEALETWAFSHDNRLPASEALLAWRHLAGPHAPRQVERITSRFLSRLVESAAVELQRRAVHGWEVLALAATLSAHMVNGIDSCDKHLCQRLASTGISHLIQCAAKLSSFTDVIDWEEQATIEALMRGAFVRYITTLDEQPQAHQQLVELACNMVISNQSRNLLLFLQLSVDLAQLQASAAISKVLHSTLLYIIQRHDVRFARFLVLQLATLITDGPVAAGLGSAASSEVPEELLRIAVVVTCDADEHVLAMFLLKVLGKHLHQASSKANVRRYMIDLAVCGLTGQGPLVGAESTCSSALLTCACDKDANIRARALSVLATHVATLANQLSSSSSIADTLVQR